MTAARRCPVCGWHRCPESCPGSVATIEAVEPEHNPMGRTTMLGAGPGRLIIQSHAGSWMVDRSGWHPIEVDRDSTATAHEKPAATPDPRPSRRVDSTP